MPFYDFWWINHSKYWKCPPFDFTDSSTLLRRFPTEKQIMSALTEAATLWQLLWLIEWLSDGVMKPVSRLTIKIPERFSQGSSLASLGSAWCETILSPNFDFRKALTAFVVWGVDPSFSKFAVNLLQEKKGSKNPDKCQIQHVHT
jgi:hypothetical protein